MTTPQTKYLTDYQTPSFRIHTIDLTFQLEEHEVQVTSRLKVSRITDAPCNLSLDGRKLELLSLTMDDAPIAASDYTLADEKLTLLTPPATFTLTISTRILPHQNTSLEGLYKSNSLFCTQCEAEGFRTITFFPDRPDVMSRYTTTIEADKSRYPVLLANGNRILHEDLPDNRHRATWQDPFPKPCYLFALVAGDLSCIRSSFTTRSKRSVALEIYVEHHNADKCSHAMDSLKHAMKWDEERFGLEYDLDQYMIVAVDDFNAGAMENKGLNIFNSKYILAKPQTATDSDYEGIESVVAHEYFHNWTGNRITCRDWFQLSLKEGLTVFRDQEFTSDTISRAVKRIADVTGLRNHQFPEDAGPMAHPVRPQSYIEINNFYTLTVYEKGAEVIRMLHTLLGEETFQKGMQLYVSRHDGQAVTCDDFVQAMEDALHASDNELKDLSQFRLWYCQAGTPQLHASAHYDPTQHTYELTIRQQAAAVTGQAEKMLHIPLKMGLLSERGQEIPLLLAGEEERPATSRVLHITTGEQTFRFVQVPSAPIPSLLRDFSAPVRLEYPYSDQELATLLLSDPDPFNRWEAAQRLFINKLLTLVQEFQAGKSLIMDATLSSLFAEVLKPSFAADKSFVAQILSLPSEEYLAELVQEVDVDAIHAARQFVRKQLGRELQHTLLSVYHSMPSEPYRYQPERAGQRRLKNLCLHYLMAAPEESTVTLCQAQLQSADNMTDEISALQALVHAGCPEEALALDNFYRRWKDEALVLDKWFTIQATSPQPATLQKVTKLLEHPSFKIRNPNKVRALIGAFAGANPVCFHEKSGAGYRFLADMVIELNALNPHIAARLAGRLSRWKRYDSSRQLRMQEELSRILATKNISKGVYEIVSRSLDN